MCKQLGISHAAYYKWLHRTIPEQESENTKLAELIKEYDERFGHILGYRRMTSWINHFNHTSYSRNRVHRIMRKLGIHSIIRKKKKKYPSSRPETTAENKLKREFNATKPNEKWATDVTEFKVPETGRKLYLSVILDLYDRFPVAYVISGRNDNKLVFDTYDKALKDNPDARPIFHSDRGFQYTSRIFQKRLREQGMLSAYKLGTMIKISNELLNDSAFDLATYIARRFGVRMGNAEERAFITGDGVGKPLGLLAETGGAKVGVTAGKKDAVTFDEIFKLYYALKAPYRKKAQFLCNEALVLQLMTIKDNNGNYIWKPGLEIGKPDTLLNRPLKTSAFMPEIKGGSKVMAFGDYSYYWVADRQNRTFRRLNELYARTDQVGFLTTQRVDGKLILPEAVQLLQMAPQG